jgi:hypothetical protein
MITKVAYSIDRFGSYPPTPPKKNFHYKGCLLLRMETNDIYSENPTKPINIL